MVGRTAPVYDQAFKAWRTDVGLFPDPNQNAYQIGSQADPVIPPTITPATCINLFSAQEQVAIQAAIAGKPSATPPVAPDAILSVFWTRLNDPRLTSVVLASQEVQGAIQYALTVANNAGAIQAPATVQSRFNQIMTGQII